MKKLTLILLVTLTLGLLTPAAYAFECAEESWLQPGEGICTSSADCCGYDDGDTSCSGDGFCKINEGSSCLGYPTECAEGLGCEFDVCVDLSSECTEMGGSGCAENPEGCCFGTCSIGGNGNSQCVPVAEGGFCDDDGDCETGLDCISNICTADTGAPNCGDLGTIGACGDVDVACPIGQKCQLVSGSPVCAADPSCLSAETECSWSLNLQCNAAGGCSTGSRCICADLDSCACVADADCTGGGIPGDPFPGVDVEYQVIDPFEFMKTIGAILFPAGLGIAGFYIVKAGWCLGHSQGDPKKTQECQSTLTSAIIGMVFLLLSVAILRIIINTMFGGTA